MAWESFLRKTADEFGLTPDQTEVFLTRFSKENKQKSDSDVQKLFEAHHQLDPAAYKKRRSGLYNKFQWNIQNPNGCKELINAGSHKAKCLLKWLEARYADEAPELENPDNSFKADEANHLARRFNKAIQQLGSDDDYVRLSGIYELEQISKDAEEKYYWQVMEILTGYVRKRSPWNKEKEAKAKTERDIPPLPDDIQKVMTVLAQRKYAYGHHLEPHPLDLHDSDLRRFQLPLNTQFNQVNFAGANFAGTNLQEVDLHEINFQKADLSKANLERANLRRINLKGANFGHADLRGATLGHANLQNAYLNGTNLQQVSLESADLQEALLTGATLQSSRLSAADLRGADLTYTQLPEAMLIEAKLQGAKLFKANLRNTSCDNIKLQGANLEFADFSGARNLDSKEVQKALFHERAILPNYLPPQPQQTRTGTA